MIFEQCQGRVTLKSSRLRNTRNQSESFDRRRIFQTSTGNADTEIRTGTL